MFELDQLGLGLCGGAPRERATAIEARSPSVCAAWASATKGAYVVRGPTDSLGPQNRRRVAPSTENRQAGAPIRVCVSNFRFSR